MEKFMKKWHRLKSYIESEHQRISEAVIIEFNKGRTHQLIEIKAKMAQIEKQKEGGD